MRRCLFGLTVLSMRIKFRDSSLKIAYFRPQLAHLSCDQKTITKILNAHLRQQKCSNAYSNQNNSSTFHTCNSARPQKNSLSLHNQIKSIPKVTRNKKPFPFLCCDKIATRRFACILCGAQKMRRTRDFYRGATSTCLITCK